MIAPFPELSERTLRFQKEWRTVALLADQAAHAKQMYPKSITADNFEQEFMNAVRGLYILHQEFWGSSTIRDQILAREEAEKANRPLAWFKANGVMA